MALHYGTSNISHFRVKQLCLQNEFWLQKFLFAKLLLQRIIIIFVIIIIFLSFDLYEDILDRIFILELSSL